MKRQLLKENPLNQAATDAKRVQDVDFPVVPAQTRNERRATDSAEIVLFLQRPHQRIALFLDPRKMAEWGIALINIDVSELPRPVEDILIELMMNKTEVG